MSISMVNHARTLNTLEAAAVKLVLSDQAFQEGASVTIFIGTEGGAEFVGIKRGNNEVKIHFGPEHDLSKDDSYDGNASSVTTAKKVTKKIDASKARDR